MTSEACIRCNAITDRWPLCSECSLYQEEAL